MRAEERRTAAAVGVTLGGAGVIALLAYVFSKRKVIADRIEKFQEDRAGTSATPQAKQLSDATGIPVSRINALLPVVIDAANAANIPPSRLAAIISAESGWSNKPNANSAKCGIRCITGGPDRNDVCATGIAQVKPTTAREPYVGVTGDLCIPANSALAGAKYLRWLFTRYRARLPNVSEDELWYIVFRAYNAGPGTADKWLAATGTPLTSPEISLRTEWGVPGGFKYRNQIYARKVQKKYEGARSSGLAGGYLASFRIG